MSILINEKEKANYQKALNVEAPIAALLNRVIVIQIREEEKELKDKTLFTPFAGEGGFGGTNATLVEIGTGGLVAFKNVLEREKKEDKEHIVVKAIVKSVGPLIDKERQGCVKVNDLVYVFPSVFETMITIDGTDYFSYGERDLVFIATK